MSIDLVNLPDLVGFIYKGGVIVLLFAFSVVSISHLIYKWSVAFHNYVVSKDGEYYNIEGDKILAGGPYGEWWTEKCFSPVTDAINHLIIMIFHTIVALTWIITIWILVVIVAARISRYRYQRKEEFVRKLKGEDLKILDGDKF